MKRILTIFAATSLLAGAAFGQGEQATTRTINTPYGVVAGTVPPETPRQKAIRQAAEARAKIEEANRHQRELNYQAAQEAAQEEQARKQAVIAQRQAEQARLYAIEDAKAKAAYADPATHSIDELRERQMAHAMALGDTTGRMNWYFHTEAGAIERRILVALEERAAAQHAAEAPARQERALEDIRHELHAIRTEK